jgi:lysophospholipase L1-like esterase
METWDVYQIDLSGNVNDGTGHFVTGVVSPDGIHPNDTGHEYMFEGVPTTIFDNITRHDSP